MVVKHSQVCRSVILISYTRVQSVYSKALRICSPCLQNILFKKFNFLVQFCQDTLHNRKETLILCFKIREFQANTFNYKFYRSVCIQIGSICIIVILIASHAASSNYVGTFLTQLTAGEIHVISFGSHLPDHVSSVGKTVFYETLF